MFRRRVTRKQLAAALGLSSAVISRKIRGEVKWSVLDIMRTAEFLDVDPYYLLPRRTTERKAEAALPPERLRPEAKTPAQPKLDGSLIS